MFDESLETLENVVSEFLLVHRHDDAAKVALVIWLASVLADVLYDLFPEPEQADDLHAAVESIAGYILDQLRAVDVYAACEDF